MSEVHVLVVDDDSAIRSMIRSVLEEEGLSAICASNGVEALQLIEAAPPRVIVLDLQMPVMDGWSLSANYEPPATRHPSS